MVEETPSWIDLLAVSGSITYKQISKDLDLKVIHFSIDFNLYESTLEQKNRWSKKEFNAAETWRKRPLFKSIDQNIPYSCGEIEIAATLQHAGLDSVWVSEWSGFPYVPSWKRYHVKRSELKQRRLSIWSFDEDLRKFGHSENLGKRGGHPDIALFDKNLNHCFIEYKGPGDKINAKQILWADNISKMYPNEIRFAIAELA
jgi:hypothetical protein